MNKRKWSHAIWASSLFVSAALLPILLASNAYASDTISGTVNENGTLTLTAPQGYKIGSIQFASYGTPVNYQIGECHASNSTAKVEAAISNNSLSISASNTVFGDPCLGVGKRLSVVLSIEPLVVQRSLAAPSNLQGQVESTTATVSWSAPVEGNTPVERYAIFWSYDNWASGWAISSTTLSASISNIPAGSQVQIKVRADNDSFAVYSGWSNEIAITATVTPEPSSSPSPAPVEPTPQPSPTPSPSPSEPTPSPEPSTPPVSDPSPSATPEPASSPSPTVEPSPTPSPTASPEATQTSSPQPTPVPTQEPQPTPSPVPSPEPAPEPTPVVVPLPPVVEPDPISIPEPPIEEPPVPIDEPIAIEPEVVQPPEAEPIVDPMLEPTPVEPIPIEESQPIEITDLEPPVIVETLETSEVLENVLDDGNITPADVEAVVDSLMEDGLVTQAEATELIETLTDGGVLSESEENLILKVLSADGEVTQKEVNNLSETLSADGQFTTAEKELVAEALIESAEGNAVTVESIAEAGISLADLPPATPVELRQDENGNDVIITAVIADALQLLESPGEILVAIFESPAQLIFALGNLGADMSEEEREEATKTVVAATLVGNIAATAAVASIGSSAYRRNP